MFCDIKMRKELTTFHILLWKKIFFELKEPVEIILRKYSNSINFLFSFSEYTLTNEELKKMTAGQEYPIQKQKFKKEIPFDLTSIPDDFLEVTIIQCHYHIIVIQARI